MYTQDRKIVIFGTAEYGQQARWLFEQQGFHVAAFCADEAYITEGHYDGLPLVPFENLSQSHPAENYSIFIALGFKDQNHFKQKKFEQFKSLGYELASTTDSATTVMPNTTIGESSLVLNSFVFNNTTIGNNVYIGTNCSISNRVTIEDHSYLTCACHIGGYSSIGARSYLGCGVIVNNHVTIGTDCFIGSGAVVTTDVPDRSFVAPARSETHKGKAHLAWKLFSSSIK